MDKHRDNDKVKWTEEQRNRVDFPRRDHREEYAAEVAPPMESTIRNADEDVEDASTARTVGYVGLVLGIAPYSCGRLFSVQLLLWLATTLITRAVKRPVHGPLVWVSWPLSVILF